MYTFVTYVCTLYNIIVYNAAINSSDSASNSNSNSNSDSDSKSSSNNVLI